ncbi:MAG: hypothetical protein EHM48_02225 [Planctomycetaceae bacterium]|nr:MAG: hypothetical protein EHM48_02225 [Planctomycetaceae bacterium]
MLILFDLPYTDTATKKFRTFRKQLKLDFVPFVGMVICVPLDNGSLCTAVESVCIALDRKRKINVYLEPFEATDYERECNVLESLGWKCLGEDDLENIDQ